MNLHHIGMAVKNIEEARKRLSFLGHISETCLDPIQNVKLAFITPTDINSPSIELIEPVDDKSPVNNLLKKGVSLYHLCYSVKNLDEAIKEMKQYGFIPFSKPVPAVALQNKKIAFVFSKDNIIIELLEEQNDDGGTKTELL
jgi:methylmalonyl-CoA/ethylmalonyl-CoA epimerase